MNRIQDKITIGKMENIGVNRYRKYLISYTIIVNLRVQVL